MIHVSQLSFSYHPDSIIRFPDFTIAQGEHALLLGESGSGKTTLLHLLGGLLRGYQGSVSIKNQELSELSESALDQFRARSIGFIFQRNHLVSALDVEKNLLLAPYLANQKQDGNHVSKIIEELGLQGKRHARVSSLSQGQAQRVAIGRALVNNPAIILADEPTSALDDKNCERVIDLLLTLANRHQSTLLIATHDQRLKNKISKHIQINA